MIKQIILLIGIGSLAIFASSYSTDETPIVSKPIFGVHVNFQHSNVFYSFFAYIQYGDNQTHYKLLDRNTFIQYASGNWPSVYNPNKENLFEKYDVACGMYMDKSVMTKPYPYCFPVDSLWKLKYGEYPFMDKTGHGWAGKKTDVSDRQQKYLKENYNVANINVDPFLDTNMWKILHDVRDSMWIENYKMLR